MNGMKAEENDFRPLSGNLLSLQFFAEAKRLDDYYFRPLSGNLLSLPDSEEHGSRRYGEFSSPIGESTFSTCVAKKWNG